METLKEQVLALVRAVPGLTDREIADRLVGPAAGQQSVNQAARALASAGQIHRPDRRDGKLGNYPDSEAAQHIETPIPTGPDQGTTSVLSEDDVKRKLQSWLEEAGWRVQVAWGRERGTDIEAQRGRAAMDNRGEGLRLT